MAHEEAMVIAFTTSVFCALGVHTRIIRAKKAKTRSVGTIETIWETQSSTLRHAWRVFDALDTTG